MDIYDPKAIEKKWQQFWQKNNIYKTDLQSAKKPYYNLMMYPYPSAEGLHVGNVYAFTGADIHGRFKRMQGYDVFEPIGFDSGGIHSENYAISVGVHPKIQIPKNVKHFTEQLKMIGNMYDWNHSVDVMQPDYYKWTQWIFTQMFKAGLAYKKKAQVTWCPSCKTTLSDEQTLEVDNARVCERCKNPVVKKELEQWFFKITKYAEKLLQNTYKLDWTEKVLLAQRNWIGKSQGAAIKFQIPNSKFQINVFTTRPDTLFGCTFMCLSPEYPDLLEMIPVEQKKTIKEYIEKSQVKSEIERKAADKEKTGVFSGLYAINPVNNQKIPVWIADYVLMDYGHGAVMGVPAHDQRDFAFAKKYDLPIISVIVGAQRDVSDDSSEKSYDGPGTLINSGPWNGWKYPENLEKVIKFLADKKIGQKIIQYKIRDWCISRQRYWGPPIPMINCPKCDWQAVAEKDLPVLLPDTDDYLPGEAGGKAPLSRIPEFVKTTCPNCGGPAERETDVSDTFLDSSWYFLAYPNTGTKEFGGVIASESCHCEERSDVAIPRESGNPRRDCFAPMAIGARNDKISPFNPKLTKKWLPVTQYTGGAEHSVLHLLYSRFVTMALHDMGHLEFSEPFPHFFSHGMIIKDGAKMSKSRGNIVNPDQYIAKFGTDSLRMYLMFLGPYSSGGDFRDSGMIGMYKFLNRVYQLGLKSAKNKNTKPDKELVRLLHKTIKKMKHDIGSFKYNTAISSLMILVNSWQENLKSANAEIVKIVSLLLAPLAPYLAEELWQLFVGAQRDVPASSVHTQPWPKFDPKLIVDDKITIVIQVNGKIRDKIIVGAHHDAPAKGAIIKSAQNSEKIKKFLENKTIRKTIFVSGKLINFVV